VNRLLLLLVLLAACGDAGGPQGLDPIVLADNVQGAYPASITWFDQSGQVQHTVLPGFVETCVKFVSTKATDSVRYIVVVGDTTDPNASWSKQWSPWFDPLTGIPSESVVDQYPDGAEYWTLKIGPQVSEILMTAVKQPPC
jgi:hypothetical protein